MSDIHRSMRAFFKERLQFLRPIGPMAIIAAPFPSQKGEGTPTWRMYCMFGAVESNMFNIKQTVIDSINDMRSERSEFISDPLIPMSLNRIISVQPMNIHEHQ